MEGNFIRGDSMRFWKQELVAQAPPVAVPRLTLGGLGWLVGAFPGGGIANGFPRKRDLT